MNGPTDGPVSAPAPGLKALMAGLFAAALALFSCHSGEGPIPPASLIGRRAERPASESEKKPRGPDGESDSARAEREIAARLAEAIGDLELEPDQTPELVLDKTKAVFELLKKEHGARPECGEWIARTLAYYGLELQDVMARAAPDDREAMQVLITDMVGFHRKLKGTAR